MNHSIQETASYAEETASIAEELSAQADLLRDLVAQISRIVGTKIISSTVTAASSIDQLPDGMDPGLASFDIMQVPTGGNLPKDDKVHMYPCYSFEFHLVLLFLVITGRYVLEVLFYF